MGEDSLGLERSRDQRMAPVLELSATTRPGLAVLPLESTVA
jgi:hypothetical protein